MLRSMTGFGAGQGECQGLLVRAELRSVNHRHLQVKWKLPPELAERETVLEQDLRRVLERGAVNAVISLSALGGAAPVGVDLPLVSRYRELVAQLANHLGLEGDLPLAFYAGLPGVLSGRALSADEVELEPVARAALGQALAQLVDMREAEGAALARDLGVHLERLRTLATAIGARMPEVVQRLHAALRQRVEQLLSRDGPRPVPEQDLARELALLADRADVSEELARLLSHLGQMERLLLGGPSGVGRRMDFLVQEILREVNTVGSKCADAEVAGFVVEAKATLERLREQVQNVE